MNKNYFFLVLLGTSLSLVSCRVNTISGSGATTTETRTVQPFTGIDVSAPINVVVIVDNTAPISVELSGYQNLIKHIKTEIKGNVLQIYSPDDIKIRTEKDLTARITVPSLNDVELSGAADAHIQGNVTAGNFNIDISGASNIIVDNMMVSNLDAEISGAGNLQIKGGSAQKANYTVSGAGDIKAFSFQTVETEASVSGAGDIDVFASQKLHTEISGAGTIRYKGHPQINTETSGAGSLKDAN
jgi:hypothetical protein